MLEIKVGNNGEAEVGVEGAVGDVLSALAQVTAAILKNVREKTGEDSDGILNDYVSFLETEYKAETN